METELDAKANDVFGGRVVRKDLVRKVKVGAIVPVYVLEYLLGKYCATDDEEAIEAGLRLVNAILADNVVQPDESNKIQSAVRELGEYTLIDKIKVRYRSDQDKYWAELVHFGHRYIHVPERYVRDPAYERILMGGMWGQVELEHRYDEAAKGKKSPFWIQQIEPIQMGGFDLENYAERRSQFTLEEWVDLLTRSVGLEPSHFDDRTKLLFLTRLIPLCEKNFNLVELGPRGTGKSFAYQEISPYAILLTGPTTVPNLFYSLAGSGKMGLVGLWDAVAFDEVADLQKMKKEVVTTLKTYCESGTFARGKEAISAPASIVFFGNTNQPVDVLLRSSHLFGPMPDVIREDMAFLDRLHFYVPGWELPKMRKEFFTGHYGLIVDYLAEALRELRKQNYTELVDHHFSLGSHLNARDAKAVRKTVAGLVKILYPDGEVPKEELATLLELALEGRRRVKEQLKKMAPFEYHQTSFSYVDAGSREEKYVGVPEEGGRDLISTDPLAPGSVYTASVDDDGRGSLFRLEIGSAPGTGKLRIAGGVAGKMKESVKRAFAYLQGHKSEMGIARSFDNTDFHVEAIDLLGNGAACEAGIAFVVAIHSVIKKQSVLPALLILGDMSIQGNIKPVSSLPEPLQIAMDNGARRSLIPLQNKRDFLEVAADIVERVDPVFYGDPMTAAMKALGMT